jgi:hypothetical protein
LQPANQQNTRLCGSCVKQDEASLNIAQYAAKAAFLMPLSNHVWPRTLLCSQLLDTALTPQCCTATLWFLHTQLVLELTLRRALALSQKNHFALLQTCSDFVRSTPKPTHHMY